MLANAIRAATDIPAADVVAGRQCTVLFLDPANQDDAVVLTIQGALPSGGGGGTTDHAVLTNLAYAGAAHTGFGGTGIAHTWAALQTSSAGLKLAASQTIQDSGGTARILLATALPEITLTGSVRINSNAAIDSAPVTSPDTKLNISPPPPTPAQTLSALSFVAFASPEGAAGGATLLTGARTAPQVVAIGSG